MIWVVTFSKKNIDLTYLHKSIIHVHVYWFKWSFFLAQFVWLFSVTQLNPVTYGKYEYPDAAIVIGWMLGLVSLLPIPICAILAILREKGSFYDVSIWAVLKCYNEVTLKSLTCKKLLRFNRTIYSQSCGKKRYAQIVKLQLFPWILSSMQLLNHILSVWIVLAANQEAGSSYWWLGSRCGETSSPLFTVAAELPGVPGFCHVPLVLVTNFWWSQYEVKRRDLKSIKLPGMCCSKCVCQSLNVVFCLVN